MKATTNLILWIGVVLLLTATGNSQEKMRSLNETNPSFDYPNKPVAIVSRELGNKPFLKDTQVKADQDWLKNLSLGVKNVSRKTIIFLHIDMVVEKQGKLQTGVDIPIEFGRPTEPILDEAGNPTGKYRGSVLKPGEIVSISVNAAILEHWRKYLKQFEVEDFESVFIDIRYVHYDDHTGWAVGHDTREDPNDPDSWVVVGSDPDKVSTLRRRFGEWLVSFIPGSNTTYSTSQLDFILPAEGRSFF